VRSVAAGWTSLGPRPQAAEDPDIAEYSDPPRRLHVQSTLVLDPGLRVAKIWNGYWSFARPTVEELRHDLRRGPAVPSRLGYQDR
jgi:hypothetical protein